MSQGGSLRCVEVCGGNHGQVSCAGVSGVCLTRCHCPHMQTSLDEAYDANVRIWDSDFENSRCPSDVSDTKLTNTDDSRGLPCLLFIGLGRVCSMTHSLADDKKVYR